MSTVRTGTIAGRLDGFRLVMLAGKNTTTILLIRRVVLFGIRQPSLFVEVLFALRFAGLEIRDELIHNVLHGAVVADIIQGMTLMNDYVTSGTGVVLLEMLHKAAFAESVQTFGDGGGIDEVALANFAANMRIQRL